MQSFGIVRLASYITHARPPQVYTLRARFSLRNTNHNNTRSSAGFSNGQLFSNYFFQTRPINHRLLRCKYGITTTCTDNSDILTQTPKSTYTTEHNSNPQKKITHSLPPANPAYLITQKDRHLDHSGRSCLSSRIGLG